MNRILYTWLCALIIAFGGFMWGYEVGSINGVKEVRGFRQTFNISYTTVIVSSSLSQKNDTATATQCSSEDDVETSALLGAIVSVFSIGALVGGLLSGLLSDFAGRKVTLVIGASLCSLGGAVQTSSLHLWMLFLGRAISGMGIGTLLQVSPVYIAEIAPKEKRGLMVSLVNGFSTTGSVVGMAATFVAKEIAFGWRVTLSLHFLCGTALALCALLLPETPRFLVKKHQDTKALRVLAKIHQDSKAQDELVNIQSSMRNSNHQTFRQLLKYTLSKSILLRIFIGMSLTLVVRGIGTSIIVVYSVSIFCKVGVDGYIGSVVLLIVNFFAQIFGFFIISKCGRKPLLLLGTMVMGGALVAAATLIQAVDLEGALELSVGKTVAGYFVIALVTLFVSVNTSTIATIVYIVLSEIYPLRIRGISAALSQLGWWGGIFLLGEVGPVLLASPLRTSGTLYLLSGMCLLAFLHVLFLIPETKDQSLEDIDDLFSKSWSKRANVAYYLKFGCFSSSLGVCKRRLVQEETFDDTEESKQLQEPLDQISMTSIDSDEDCEPKPEVV